MSALDDLRAAAIADSDTATPGTIWLWQIRGQLTGEWVTVSEFDNPAAAFDFVAQRNTTDPGRTHRVIKLAPAATYLYNPVGG